MFKVKNVIVSACTIFFLSFVISIFSTHKVGISLLRALVFACLFALIDVFVQFISKKFLDDGESSLEIDTGVSSSHSDMKSGNGNIVDITISDEPLSDDESSLKFDVRGNRQTLPASDVSSSKMNSVGASVITDVGDGMSNIPTARSSENLETGSTNDSEVMPAFTVGQEKITDDKTDSSKSFVKINLAGKDADVSIGDSSLRKQNSNSGRDANRKEIANLPDMDNLVPEETESSAVDTSILQGSMSADESFSPAPKKTENSTVMSKDTETMAKAIRTLLNRE